MQVLRFPRSDSRWPGSDFGTLAVERDNGARWSLTSPRKFAAPSHDTVWRSAEFPELEGGHGDDRPQRYRRRQPSRPDRTPAPRNARPAGRPGPGALGRRHDAFARRHQAPGPWRVEDRRRPRIRAMRTRSRRLPTWTSSTRNRAASPPCSSSRSSLFARFPTTSKARTWPSIAAWTPGGTTGAGWPTPAPSSRRESLTGYSRRGQFQEFVRRGPTGVGGRTSRQLGLPKNQVILSLPFHRRMCGCS